jgi:3'-5' exoribonuclease
MKLLNMEKNKHINCEYLSNIAKELKVYNVSSVVLENPKFKEWSGSSKPNQHHYGQGGLCQHTREVVKLCFSTIKTLKLSVDKVEVYLSALFHDYGKIWDYSSPDYDYLMTNYRSGDRDLLLWTSTEHKRCIHHVSRSAIEWNLAVTKCNIFDNGDNLSRNYADRVTHNILSHHGQREWGSPVAPKSREAWLLHLCDGLSARMCDANTFDCIKERTSQ